MIEEGHQDAPADRASPGGAEAAAERVGAEGGVLTRVQSHRVGFQRLRPVLGEDW